MNIYDVVIKTELIDYISSVLNDLRLQVMHSPDYVMIIAQIIEIVRIIYDINTMNAIANIYGKYYNFLAYVNAMQINNIEPVIRDILLKISQDPFVMVAYQQIISNPEFSLNYFQIDVVSNVLIIKLNTSGSIEHALRSDSNINTLIKNIYNIIISSKLLDYVQNVINKLIETNQNVDDYNILLEQIRSIIDILYDENNINLVINLINMIYQVLLKSAQTPILETILQKIYSDKSVAVALETLYADPFFANIINSNASRNL
jgi:hypothetical protein